MNILKSLLRLESGLTCFECSSTVSHEECQERHQQVTCQSSMADRCYYASMQQTSQDGSSVTKRFKHGCINNKDCSNTANIFDKCTTSTGQCEVRCCSENLCNEGNVGTTVNNIKLPSYQTRASPKVFVQSKASKPDKRVSVMTSQKATITSQIRKCPPFGSAILEFNGQFQKPEKKSRIRKM